MPGETLEVLIDAISSADFELLDRLHQKMCLDEWISRVLPVLRNRSSTLSDWEKMYLWEALRSMQDGLYRLAKAKLTNALCACELHRNLLPAPIEDASAVTFDRLYKVARQLSADPHREFSVFRGRAS
jgi:hypothetical protein